MASSMDNFDKLMMAMALKRIVEGSEDLKLHPFTCEIIATPMSIECVTSGNKALLEDLDGGKEWFQETNDRIKDIMSEQTTKLTEIMKKKFGFETIAADSNSKDGFGAVIRFTLHTGESIELLKHAAAYQFKRPFWFCQSSGRYMPATRIPANYEVVTA